ncbi:MAG: amidase, partial [Hyphomicrobiales bacterium]|nr:amidase [Hyphomicrobiales bacterium]
PPRLGEGHTGSRLAQRLWTHTGMPAVTVPVTRAGPLPVGVQIVARRGTAADPISIARMLEAAE